MLRIDSIEPILKEVIIELQQLQSPHINNCVLEASIMKLQHIVSELDTCMSLVCQERWNKEF